MWLSESVRYCLVIVNGDDDQTEEIMMTAATGSSPFSSTLAAAFAAAALTFAFTACQPANPAKIGKRVEAKWVDRQLLFVGDSRQGAIRVFHMRASPLQVAEIRAPGRDTVRDIALDPAAGRIWVLGDGAVFLHDARTFSLVRRIPGAGSASTRLALDAGGAPLLLDADGVQLARVDPATLFLQWQQLATGGR